MAIFFFTRSGAAALILLFLSSLAAADWWDRDSMKALLGGEGRSGKLIGYERGPNPKDPDYAFLASDLPGGRRYLVSLRRPKVLVTFDLTPSSSTHAVKWSPPIPAKAISSMHLAGVRLAGHIILFHTGTTMTRSIFFEVEGGDTLQYVIVGLFPGTWEIWRNGFLEDPEGVVNRESGVLYFEGPPGNYYLKRLY